MQAQKEPGGEGKNTAGPEGWGEEPQERELFTGREAGLPRITPHGYFPGQERDHDPAQYRGQGQGVAVVHSGEGPFYPGIYHAAARDAARRAR